MVSVAVVMSTYNGEKYLREQLDSILNQVDVDVKIFVRDDGSSDGTYEILSEYLKNHENICVEFGKNEGVGSSFMDALYSVPATFDYYAFADQDDIWLENKLIEAVKLLNVNKEKQVYFSNQECIDGNGNSLGLRWKPNDDNVYLSTIGILCQNVLCGCTMVFTNAFYKIIKTEELRPSSTVLNLKNHDGWIALVASLDDLIIFDDRSFMLYRQHGGNVVGAYQAGFRKKISAKFKKLFNSELRNYRSKTANELCEKFPCETNRLPLIKICAKTSKFKDKRTILKNYKNICCYTNESYLNFRFKVLFGLF